jgi:GNAT superfamily N-acetyltransferase
MPSSTPSRAVIRDGVEADVPRCVALDHSFDSEYVYQIQVSADEENGWAIVLRKERLPRAVEMSVPADPSRLKLAVPESECFLVAQHRETGDVLGYLAMQHDRRHRLGLIHDLTVDRPERRQQVGSRLLGAARVWAKEHQITRMNVEIQSKNLHGIQFFEGLGFNFCGYNDRLFPNQDVALFFSTSLR